MLENNGDSWTIRPMDFSVTDVLDATGLLCPEPVMMLHNKIRDISSGEVLQVIATDPSTQRDIPKFCSFLGHTLLHQQQRDQQYCYYIQKA